MLKKKKKMLIMRNTLNLNVKALALLMIYLIILLMKKIIDIVFHLVTNLIITMEMKFKQNMIFIIEIL